MHRVFSLRIGDAVTGASLLRAYDDTAYAVLTIVQNCIRPIKVGRHSWGKYVIVRDLPTLEAFKALKKEKFTLSGQYLLNEGLADLRALGVELSEWQGSLRETFATRKKAQLLEESSDFFISLPEMLMIPAEAFYDKVYCPDYEKAGKAAGSKERRRDIACSKLLAVVKIIDNYTTIDCIALSKKLTDIIKAVLAVQFVEAYKRY
jgi:hypothetical protein